jgi:hypothetical protein
MGQIIKDEELADEVRQIEKNPGSPQESRKKIIQAVSRRYTHPEASQ